MKRSTRDRLKLRIAEVIKEYCTIGEEFNVHDVQNWWDAKYKRNDAPSTKRISRILPSLDLIRIDNYPKVYGYMWDGESEMWAIVDPYENAP